MKLRVFSASHNSHKYGVNCIESVARQTFTPYEHYYIDDCSEDDTTKWIQQSEEKILKIINGRYNIDLRAVPADLKYNPELRRYKLLNLYEYVTECDPEDVICVLDGDDWLGTADALEKVAHQYLMNPSVKYVYTNWQYSHNNQLGISKPIPNNDWNPYKSSWITSAMSTFKVSEFLKIPISNFLRWDYRWFTMGCDQAYVLPILWQIWKEEGNYDSVKFINEPLYIYQFAENPSKPRNDYDTASKNMRMDAHNSVDFIKKRGYVNWEY